MASEDALRRILDPGQPLSEDDVRRFLALRIPEGLRLDYKEKVSDDSLVKTIAAMANTAGGAVLVGVAEDKNTKLPMPDPPGVSLADRDSLTARAFDRLEPTFQLDLETVEVGSSGMYVLVVRINEQAIDRPVIVNGCVYIRIEGHSRPAARPQIMAMFPVSASLPVFAHSIGPGRNLEARNGSYSLVHSAPPGLAMRLALGCEVPRWQRVGLLRSNARKTFAEAVAKSTLELWLQENADDASAPGSWALEGTYTSSTVAILRRQRRPTVTAGWFVDAQAVLDLPHHESSGGLVMLYLDVAFLPQPRADGNEATTMAEAPSPPFRFTLQTFYNFVDVLINTALVNIGPTIFPLLAGSDWQRGYGPRLAIDTWPGMLDDFIDFGTYPRAKESRSQSGTTFETTLTDDVNNRDVRHSLLIDWLELLYLNQGYLDYEPALEKLGHT